MTEWIIEADKDSVYYMFKQYAPLVRCKDCEYHRHRAGMCDVYHVHKSGNGFCDRAKAVKKNDTE